LTNAYIENSNRTYYNFLCKTPILLEIKELYENSMIYQNNLRPTFYLHKKRQDGHYLSFKTQNKLKLHKKRILPDTITVSLIKWPTMERLPFPQTYTMYEATFYFIDIYLDDIGNVSIVPGPILIGSNYIVIHGGDVNYHFAKYSHPYTISGWTTADPITDANLIEQMNASHILYPTITRNFVYFPSPIDVSSANPDLESVEIMIRANEYPQFSFDLQFTHPYLSNK
jgi:hypothetical protein